MFDYTKLPSTLLLELINADNGTSIPSQALTFGLPAAMEGGEKNTSIVVTAVPGQGYRNSQTMTYDRVPVSGFVGTVDLTYLISDLDNYAALISAINATLNINLTADDYVVGELPEFPSLPNTVIDHAVMISQSSFVYNGELDIKITNGNLSLMDLVSVTELDGFFIDPSQIVDGKPQISTLFTSNVLPGF